METSHQQVRNEGNIYNFHDEEKDTNRADSAMPSPGFFFDDTGVGRRSRWHREFVPPPEKLI